MPIDKLNRYTSLPVLLDLLNRKKLVLLDPKSWDDKNDSEIIAEYAKRKGLNRVFALCFSFKDETVHHWKTYADGISGCCIEFDAVGLLSVITKIPQIRHGKVVYRKIYEVENARNEIPIKRIPFTKRWPYRIEHEYRIIWEGDTADDVVEIDIPLDIIRKVTISQQMPKPVYNSIKNILKGKHQDVERVNRSTIYENRRWINCFKNNETSHRTSRSTGSPKKRASR